MLYFYLCFVLFLIVRYANDLFLTQIIDNPIRSPRVDLVVWTTQSLGIPNLMTQSWLSMTFDALILILPLVILYQTWRGRSARKPILALSVLFGLYILIIYCFPTLSIRKYLGLVLLPFAFVFASEKRYKAYLELMRYFVLFIFTSASMWKIVRGVAWDPYHMQLSLKAQHIDNFVNWPDHYITDLIAQFVHNSTYCAILFASAVLSQIAFSIGFFTKKYDRYLALLLLIFVITDYLVMRIEYWEFAVFLPLFYTWNDTKKASKRV